MRQELRTGLTHYTPHTRQPDPRLFFLFSGKTDFASFFLLLPTRLFHPLSLPLLPSKAEQDPTMSNAIVDAVQKHPAPEGLKYTYGTAGVCAPD